MLSQKELIEIRKEIEESQNPFFLFDNDPDGLSSAAILIKNFQKGIAFPFKSFPNIDYSLREKIEKTSPDKIFVLDKPLSDENFLNSMNEKGIKVLIIDHHELQISENLKSKVKIFNSFPSSEPTSYICQKICNNKNTIWISLVGCIHDVFLPEFIGDFKGEFPEMVPSKIDISTLKYTSEIGEISLMTSLALKSSNQTIQNILDLFINATGPKDLYLENEKNSFIHKKYKQMNKIIDRTISKAKIFGNLVFLEYSGEYSLSSDIANKLYFKNPNKFIAVCYKKYDAINISLRGVGAKKFTEKFVSSNKNSMGGGHEVACGLRIYPEIFEDFKKELFTKFRNS